MNVSCDIIRNLLPLYEEGLCSEASRTLVETHTASCEECRRLMGRLPDEALPDAPVPEEGRAMRKLNRMLRSNRFTKVMSVIFCVLLVLFAGWNAAWYVLSYRPYRALCEGWQSSGIGKGTQYVRQDGNFSYMVKMPGYLEFGGGFISLQTKESCPVGLDANGHPVVEVGESVSVMFIWLAPEGTQYGVDIQCGNTGYQMYIDRELNLIPFDGQTEEDIAERRRMIGEHRTEIEALMDAAQSMWGSKL